MTMTLEQVRDWHRELSSVRKKHPVFAAQAKKHADMADAIDAHITQPAQSVDVQWVETPPAESGWYWHWDGESYRMHFVFARPGHSYLCTEGEPYGPGQKRNFQAVQRMGGKWSSKVEPPPLRRQTHRRATGEG